MTDKIDIINECLNESIRVKQSFSQELKNNIVSAVQMITDSLKQGGRVLTAGNGGSASDAQHFAAELVGRFLKDRQPYDATALTTNSSTFTSIANDYSAENIYARQLEAHARKGDVFLAISTSGNSPNVLLAIEAARAKGVSVIGLTGEAGGKMAGKCDILLNVPSSETPRIQESHIFIIHMICQLVEVAMCK